MRTLEKRKYVKFRDNTAGLLLKEDDEYYYFSFNDFSSAYLEKTSCRLINGPIPFGDKGYFENKNGVSFIWVESIVDRTSYYDTRTSRLIF